MTYLLQVFVSSMDILNETSFWLVISFVIAGLLHNIISPERLQRSLGNRSLPALVRSTVSGMLLPICSCGVIPLGVGLYYSGSYLGPTLSFMTATPIINPVAVLLTFGFLGPQLGTLYLICGIIIALLVGIIANRAAGPELYAPPGETSLELESEESSLPQKLVSGLKWGFADLGTQVSKYVVWGMLLAGLILASVPVSFIQRYLGSPGLISIVGMAVLGGIMYVCAVGHIPFIAALVASGAAPGAAITFLMAGAATNIPELVSIYKLIGRRAMLIYGLGVTILSMLAGYLTNCLLLPGFTPMFDLSHSEKTIGLANSLLVATPQSVHYLCSLLVLGLFFSAYWPQFRGWLSRTRIMVKND